MPFLRYLGQAGCKLLLSLEMLAGWISKVPFIDILRGIKLANPLRMALIHADAHCLSHLYPKVKHHTIWEGSEDAIFFLIARRVFSIYLASFKMN